MTFYIGQTIKISVTNLTDVNGDPIVSPVVTMVVTNPNESTENLSVTNVGSEYRGLFLPSLDGAHVVRVTATAGGGTWRSEKMIYVHDFS